MSAAFKCDRCRKFQQGSPHTKLTLDRRNTFGFVSVSMDLCGRCAGDVRAHVRRVDSYGIDSAEAKR